MNLHSSCQCINSPGMNPFQEGYCFKVFIQLYIVILEPVVQLYCIALRWRVFKNMFFPS